MAASRADASQLPDVGTFTGFPRAGLTFLRDLEKNNERAWFNERKETYLRDVKAPLESLVAELSRTFRAARIPLAPDPRKLSFRIYRDVRFSADKRPYNTFVSTAFYRGGDVASAGVLYVQLDPKAPFVAAGFYRPEKAVLESLRTAMAADPKRFGKLCDEIQTSGTTISGEDRLVRMPPAYKEFAEQPIAHYLKMKSLIARKSLTPRALAGAEILDDIQAFARSSHKLLQWGWKTLEPS